MQPAMQETPQQRTAGLMAPFLHAAQAARLFPDSKTLV